MSNDFVWQVRHTIYQHFAEQRRAPFPTELAVILDQPEEKVVSALKRLSENHHALALVPETGNIQMAWPFSAVPTQYPVDTPKGRYWANCAWDALAIPGMASQDSQTNYVCPSCAEEITITIKNGCLKPTKAVVHFTIQPKIFYEDLGCIWETNQLFRSEEHVDKYCNENQVQRGGVISAQQAVELGKLWFNPMLEPNWRPMSKNVISEMLEQVGLTDEFWKLDE